MICKEIFTWFNRIADVDDSIVTMVLRSRGGLVDDNIREEGLFTDDFFGKINSAGIKFDGLSEFNGAEDQAMREVEKMK